MNGALVLQLGVVVKVALDPCARRQLLRPCLQLVDDAGDGDEFDFERIADEDFVEQGGAYRMVVAIDEARDDGHAFGVEGLRARAGKRFHGGGCSDASESSTANEEGLGARMQHPVKTLVDDENIHHRRQRGRVCERAMAAARSHGAAILR